LLTVLIIMI